MFARTLSIRLRPNMLSDYTRAFEKDALPVLRKQNGFRDEITFSNAAGVTAISLWDSKANAEAYNTNTYPEVLKSLAKVIDGTPTVQIGEVVQATSYKLTTVATA